MKWAALLALALAALCSPAAAATLYISEFSNGITPVNSSQPQVPPTPSLADQTVALSGASASSAAFGSATHVVSLICDEGCSVQFGTAPTATTSTLLLQQGVTYLFGVVPGGKVAAIANAAGNSAAGGTVTANQGTAGTNAQAWWTRIGDATNGPAAVKAASTAPAATDPALVVAISPNGQLPAGQATMANSTPVVIASDQTAVAVSAASLPLPSGAATSANQTNANQKTQIVDGSGNVIASTSSALNVSAVQATASNLNAQVVGNAASAASDSGNPVKIGAVFLSARPTFTNGQRGDWQMSSRGEGYVAISQGATVVGVTGGAGDGGGTNSALVTQGQNQLYNGSTWDRIRSGGVTGMTGVTPQATPSGAASYSHIAAGQATTTVKSGAGTLYAIVLNSAATATNVTTVYDNTAGSGTVIAIPAATTATIPTTVDFGPVGLAFATGLTIVTATANGSDMTVVYK